MNATPPMPVELAPDVFALNEGLELFGMRLGHRMTVVRLASGGLWLHSPVRYRPELLAVLEELGPVEALVAPSRMHDLYLGEWLEALVGARSSAPASLREAHPEWRFDASLGEAPEPAWAPEFERVFLAGVPRIDEHVFLHRASRTLIAADLIFNVTERQRLLPGLLMRAAGAFGPIRTDLPFRALIRDRRAFRASIARLLELDFERVVVGHGAVLGPDEVGAVRDHLRSL